MSALQIGIVGARFAAELHATNYRPMLGPRVELAAVCARTRGQAEDFARRHAISRVFTDYPQELEDFVSAISERREPLSGGFLAREVVEVIYAGYVSAATGRRVELARP